MVERCAARGVPCHVLNAQVTDRARRASGSPENPLAHFERLRAEASDPGPPAYIVAAHTATIKQKPCCSTSCVLPIRSPSPPCLLWMQSGLCALPRLELSSSKHAAPGTGNREDASNAKPDYLRNGFGTRCCLVRFTPARHDGPRGPLGGPVSIAAVLLHDRTRCCHRTLLESERRKGRAGPAAWRRNRCGWNLAWLAQASPLAVPGIP